MVFFCCNGCGETLKKQKVEAHSYSCRSSVSCIDCNVNFQGNDYKKHTQCVTEAQRYQGHLYEAKENKGALKQNSWMDHVRVAAESCKHNPQLKGLLVRIAQNDNVPRKKAKFLNFIKNSMKVMNKSLVEQAWSEIEKAGSLKEDTLKNDIIATDGNKEPPKSGKRKRIDNIDNCDSTLQEQQGIKKKKACAKNDGSIVTSNSNHVNGIAPETPGRAKKYKISNHIKELILSKGDMSIKKLKRKVTQAYIECNPHKTMEDAAKIFDKRISNVSGIIVQNGRAFKEDLKSAAA